MAILQVNRRPADRSCASLGPQGRENGSAHISFQQRTGQHSIRAAHSSHPPKNQAIGPIQSVSNFQGPATQHTLNGGDGTAIAPQPLPQNIMWSLTSQTPVGRALVSATQRLTGAGCENPRLDAQVLLAHALGTERTWLFAHHDHPLSVEQAEAFTDLVARRIRREPVAYLLGRKEFYGLEFAVDERVLIPRPETEMLVDFLLAHVQARPRYSFVVADVGTGSGVIAVTTAALASNTRTYGLDISEDALDVARENGRRLAPNARLRFLHSDLLSELPEPADVIVANLPYVTDSEYSDLAPEIRDYEPQLALTAGDKGLDVIQRLLDQVSRHLKADGLLLLEIGHNQGDAVKRMAEAMRPKPRSVGVRQDYSGHPRMVTIEF